MPRSIKIVIVGGSYLNISLHKRNSELVMAEEHARSQQYEYKQVIIQL